MGLEVATYISGLNASNPVNATDGVNAGDDHLRLIKSTLLNTLPNLTGAMNASHTELNHLVGITGKTGTGNVVLSASPTLTGTLTAAAITASGIISGIGSGLTGIPEAQITQHEGAINHDALANFAANEHIDHAGVLITAGAGLTGGGAITATRTLDVGAGDGISVSANAVAVDATVVRTTGAQTIAGDKTFSNDVSIGEQLKTPGIITDDIAGSTAEANYNPTGLATASIVRIVHTATCAISGLAGGAAGRRIILCNADGAGFALNCLAENAGSSAANRFTVSVTIADGESAEFWYDDTSNRWRPITGV